MAFDRNNQAHLTALKSEYDNDPASIGYASIGNTNTLVDTFNSDSSNTTGATVNKPVEELLVPEVSGVINTAEYTALTEYDKEWVKSMIVQTSGTNLALYKDKFLAIFPSGSATRTAATALLSTAASRAEELFGYGTILTKDDWIAARDNG